MNPTPWDFTEATAAARKATEAQKEAEQARRDATSSYADAERIYRMALAKRIVELHAEGCAWTVAQDVARGDKGVAQLKYLRDVAEGVKAAAEQRAWRHTSDRRDVNELIAWSRIVAPLGQQTEPAGAQRPAPIGARRAA